jgi:hypothetical protein
VLKELEATMIHHRDVNLIPENRDYSPAPVEVTLLLQRSETRGTTGKITETLPSFIFS